MSSKRRSVNISLIVLSLILGVWTVGIVLQSMPKSISTPAEESTLEDPAEVSIPNTISNPEVDTPSVNVKPLETAVKSTTEVYDKRPPANTRFNDADIRSFIADNPFSVEARKVLSGNLEESDSVSRHRILSYCEHLRTSYTTRDIDFLRQVFSDNALIIVGHTVKTGQRDATGVSIQKISYGIRSKKEYLERLERIFNSNRKIEVEFSDFKIMRHPTMMGIYGVTLRQKYSCDTYSDDGFLFLLWDFRDASMPLIHVRTWQPSLDILNGSEEVIEIGDFNLE